MRSLPVLFAVLLAGCETVTSSTPVGERPVVLEARQWDGIWLHEETAITVLVLDGEQGRLEAGWIEPKGGRLVAEVVQGEVRQSGDWWFFNTPLESEADDPRYGFARVKVEDGRILFWTPDFDGFATAVKGGRLPGTVDEDDVHLTGLKPEHVARIIEGGTELFDWEQPVVFIRYRE